MIKQCKSFEIGNFKIEYVYDGENEYIYLNGEPFEKTDITDMIDWIMNEVLCPNKTAIGHKHGIVIEAEIVQSLPEKNTAISGTVFKNKEDTRPIPSADELSTRRSNAYQKLIDGTLKVGNPYLAGPQPGIDITVHDLAAEARKIGTVITTKTHTS